ncbi:MAG: hypothetical protein H0X50_04810 [Nitrosopumilus sp.]|nr:hypothetical protein [Nitrosopumilus sp.]
MNNSENNFDRAKSSSDEVLSLIDSLKGSSLIDSVVGGMENFTLTGINQSNDTGGEMENFTLTGINQSNDTGGEMGLFSDSADYNPTVGIDQNVTNNGVNNRTTLMIKTSTNQVNSNLENVHSSLVLPYPMSIQSKDYVPLYSSLPLKISNGTVLAKLPCDDDTKSLLQIVGSSADNAVFSINLNLIPTLSTPGSMCMYQSVIPNDLSNLLYSQTLTSIYLYNSLNIPIEVPTTTSIFIGIHKLTLL